MAEEKAESSPLASTTGLPVKYTVEHYRKEGVSEEAFIEWFTNVHLPHGVPLMKKHGIVKYAVHKRDAKIGAAFQAELDKAKPGWEVSQCDLVLEYWAYDLSCTKSLLADPDWNEKACKNQEDWVDMSRAMIHIGYDTTYLENGQVINLDSK